MADGTFDTGSFLGSFSEIVSGVGTVAGLASTVMGYSERQKALKTSEAQVASTAATQDMLRQLAYKNLAAVESMTDNEAYRETARLFRAILSGEEPQNIGAFRSQFDEIEYATAAQLKDIEASAENERRKIVDQVAAGGPSGGMKLRMLADVSLKQQDKKAAVMAEARNKIRQTNIELKNQYLTKALEFGKAQPENLVKGYQVSGAILTGQPTTTGETAAQLKSANEMLAAGGTALKELGKSMSPISGSTTQAPVSSLSTPTYSSAPAFVDYSNVGIPEPELSADKLQPTYGQYDF